ncbi:MAG: hypothetical protein HAW67_04180 [Endozoicomonadaceae bacterium]|nr:hypothetical protein [Endozoicomonadaceae bacterium]
MDNEKEELLPHMLLDKYAAEYDLLFKGKQLEDKELQDKLIGNIVNQSLGEVALFASEYASAKQELLEHSLSLIGMNKKGESFSTEDYQDVIPNLLDQALFNEKSVYSSEVLLKVLQYAYNTENNKYDQDVKDALSNYLTEERLTDLNNMARSTRKRSKFNNLLDKVTNESENCLIKAAVMNAKLTTDAPDLGEQLSSADNEPQIEIDENDPNNPDLSEFPEPTIEATNLNESLNDAPNLDEPSINNEPTAQHPSDVEDAPVATPVNESTDIAPEDANLESASIPDDSYEQNAASVEPDITDDEYPYKVTEDLLAELERREMDLLKNSEPMMQIRGFKTKLEDLIKHRARDMFDPVPLQYPSEPLFNETLVAMDENGRVSSKPLLQFKNGKVVMPSAKVPDEVYEMMAVRTLKNGVRKPHIKCNFHNPSEAQEFLRKTVNNLVDVGYDIEDMTVQPKMQVYFDKLKADLLENQFTIQESRPDLTEAPTPEANHELSQSDEFELANQSVSEVSRLMNEKQENFIPVNQLTSEQIKSVLESNESSLTEVNKKTYKEVADYSASLISKLSAEGIGKLGSNEQDKVRSLSDLAVLNAYGEQALAKYKVIMENNEVEPSSGLAADEPKNKAVENEPEINHTAPEYEASPENDASSSLTDVDLDMPLPPPYQEHDQTYDEMPPPPEEEYTPEQSLEEIERPAPPAPTNENKTASLNPELDSLEQDEGLKEQMKQAQVNSQVIGLSEMLDMDGEQIESLYNSGHNDVVHLVNELKDTNTNFLSDDELKLVKILPNNLLSDEPEPTPANDNTLAKKNAPAFKPK